MKAKFVEAVENGNLLRVRLFLADELLLDPRGKSFQEMKRFAEKHILNLYEIDDSKCYASDESEWNEELLFLLKNNLDDNFSKEKLALCAAMAKVVLKVKIEELDKRDAERAAVTVNDTDRHRQGKRPISKLYTGITIGSAVVAVAGLCLSRVALTSIGLAGVVIGGFLLLNDSKK